MLSADIYVDEPQRKVAFLFSPEPADGQRYKLVKELTSVRLLAGRFFKLPWLQEVLSRPAEGRRFSLAEEGKMWVASLAAPATAKKQGTRS